MGDRVRISVQLIEAETGNHVWGERFDRAQAEIFSVQDEVVQTIVSTLVGRVHVSDAVRARRKPPASLDAYECVLQGNALTGTIRRAPRRRRGSSSGPSKSIPRMAWPTRCWRR